MNKITKLNKSLLLLKARKINVPIINDTMHKTRDAVEAFGIAMKTHFTPIPSDWKLVAKNEGAVILSDFMAVNTFKRYVTLRYFRSQDGKVYKEEVEKFRDVANTIEELFKLQVIKEEKIDGIKNFVLFPISLNKEGIGYHSQKIKAGMLAINEPWFKTWTEAIDFSN